MSRTGTARPLHPPRLAARLYRRLARWLKPPRLLRPTRAGWSFFAIIFGVGFAALNTGNNLLYLVLALMLAFLVLSGVLSEAALRGICVRRQLPREIYAGLENPVFLEIQNRGRRVPSFAIWVEDRIEQVSQSGARPTRTLHSVGSTFALRVGPGATEVRRYGLRPAQRGFHKFVEFRVSTRFPFGLFLKSMTAPAEERALVFPALDEVAPGALPRSDRLAGEMARSIPGRGSLVSGLRDFRPGDSLRRVHWKSSLRRGLLVVREVEDECERKVEVRIRTAGARPGEPFEALVRRAASRVVAHLDAGFQVSLCTDAESLESGSGSRHRRNLLSFLALVEPDPAEASRESLAS